MAAATQASTSASTNTVLKYTQEDLKNFVWFLSGKEAYEVKRGLLSTTYSIWTTPYIIHNSLRGYSLCDNYSARKEFLFFIMDKS
ncbi:hypothetical protein D5018_01250 [Parashewanella curva]|uniref:Uncharacterized protein n=1 Tax=Parashewanella curva TaxID=2338552 RepID=A0A3L8Q3R7_9GAMM|nr:hypothetical protein [Parashewanella curva]RLV61502.1 hypothetical protein D5018_01250 [Parashewanella curva]